MRLVSGDLDAPDWQLSAGGDGEHEQRSRDELAEKLAKMVVAVGAWPIGAQARWRAASAREVAWREGVEESRGVLRLCLRAWRELTDGVRAGAAAWEQRWQRSLSERWTTEVNPPGYLRAITLRSAPTKPTLLVR